MDTTNIFTLILSAFFLGGIVWLAIHSRRRQGAAVKAHRPETPAGKDVRRTHGVGR